MPYGVRRNSVVEMLSKVPVNRGSLLESVENLLKTIESSESAVMIPTLLRDKCDFDAWELLFVAKILKASILGHSDLVEFYMNHIGHSSNQFSQSNSNGYSSATEQQAALSPSAARLASPVSSPNLVSASVLENGHAANGANGTGVHQLPTSPSLSSISSVSSVTTSSQSSGPQQGSRASWTTANQSSSVSSSSSISSNSSTINESQSSSVLGSVSTNNHDSGPINHHVDPVQMPLEPPLSAPRAPTMRQAQPPSLLQLTTTNNHINSVAAVTAGFTNGNIEQLTSQLAALQGNALQPSKCEGPQNGVERALSISTTTANQQSAPMSLANGLGAQMAAAATESQNGTKQPAELRTSRSAGCLFRINSGASSPRTPSTPYPQAETLANGLASQLAGDPSAPVKLLLQIEQLKSSISHVTNLLESVVELYKKSIDDIA